MTIFLTFLVQNCVTRHEQSVGRKKSGIIYNMLEEEERRREREREEGEEVIYIDLDIRFWWFSMVVNDI